MKISNLLLVVGTAALIGLTGCEKKEGAAAGAGNMLDKAADTAKNAASTATDAAKDAGNKVAEGAEKAVDATKDAANKATEGAKDAAEAAKQQGAAAVDAAKEGLAKLQAESKKWIDETVTKQWPDMKKGLDDAAKKVGSIADAGKKTQAEGLVKDLQAKVPAMEKLVGDLTNFKDGDFSKLFTEAKTMWDGFASKFADLKKLLPA